MLYSAEYHFPSHNLKFDCSLNWKKLVSVVSHLIQQTVVGLGHRIYDRCGVLIQKMFCALLLFQFTGREQTGKQIYDVLGIYIQVQSRWTYLHILVQRRVSPTSEEWGFKRTIPYPSELQRMCCFHLRYINMNLNLSALSLVS